MNITHKKFLLLTTFFLLVLILVEIWVIHTLSKFGEKVKRLEQLQQNLKEENDILENEISRQSSLPKIASAAASYGLDNPKTVQYIH